MKKIAVLLFLVAVILVSVFYFVQPCDFTGGWGLQHSERPSACDCKGVKIVTQNDLSVDGNYETMCIGIATPKEIQDDNIPEILEVI